MKHRRVGGPIKCTDCGKVFKTQAGFNNHKHKKKNPSLLKGERWIKAKAVRIYKGVLQILK
jgi:hypothetical protein